MANHKASKEAHNCSDKDTRSVDETRAQLGLHEDGNDPEERQQYVCVAQIQARKIHCLEEMTNIQGPSCCSRAKCGEMKR